KRRPTTTSKEDSIIRHRVRSRLKAGEEDAEKEGLFEERWEEDSMRRFIGMDSHSKTDPSLSFSLLEGKRGDGGSSIRELNFDTKQNRSTNPILSSGYQLSQSESSKPASSSSGISSKLTSDSLQSTSERSQASRSQKMKSHRVAESSET